MKNKETQKGFSIKKTNRNLSLNGWKSIFKFTYIQGVKAKSFKVSTSIMAVLLIGIVLVANFLPLMTGGIESLFGGNEGELKIRKLYLLDQSGLNSNFSQIIEQGTEIETVTEEEISILIPEIKDSNLPVAVAEIRKLGESFHIAIQRPENTDIVNTSDCELISYELSVAIEEANYISLGVLKEDLERAKAKTTTSISVAGEVPKTAYEQAINYVVPIVLSLLLFMFIFTHGVAVAQAIAGEKTSRVMELLLTSVAPLAIIIGKVAASLLISLTQIFILSAVTIITGLIAAPFGFNSKVIAEAEGMGISQESITNEAMTFFGGISGGEIILIILSFVLGFLLFALIAGLIGAGVSRSEDLQSALQPLSLIGVFGFYLAYFPTVFNFDGEGKNLFITLSYYLPISSPFALPPAILAGDIGGIETVFSLVILALSDFLLLLLIARVYERVVLYSGNRIGIKEMIKMAKD